MPIVYGACTATGEPLDVLFDDWLSDCTAEYKLTQVLNSRRSTAQSRVKRKSRPKYCMSTYSIQLLIMIFVVFDKAHVEEPEHWLHLHR